MKLTSTLKQLLKAVLVMVLILSAQQLFAQSGPAGIGNATGANGQPENLIWLDASTLPSFSSGGVWTDLSGNSNSATHINMGGNAPAISTLNSLNILDFDGSASYLRILDDGAGANRLDGMSKLAVFAVSNPGSTDTRALISKRLNSGTSSRSWTLFHNGGYQMNGYAGSANAGGGANTSGAFGVSSMIVDGNIRLFYNGNLQATGGSGISIPDRSENISIGRFDETPSETRYYNGEIAEIIVYRGGINTAQRNVIESYLATKWGLTIGANKYVPTDGTFVQNISGAGAESDGTLALGNSSGLYLAVQDSVFGDYVMAGHDGRTNDVASINTGGDVTASGAQAAWNRFWYVQQTGTPTVRLSFDLSEGITGGKYPQEITNYVLLRKDTPTGNYTQVTTALKGVEVGDRIYFEVVDADFADGYFTLGTLDNTASPLQGGDRRIWYTLRSTANWNSPDAWTLEPCGCLPNNPNGYTPITSPTSGSDKVVVLSGKKITVPVGVNNLANAELIVNGELDLQTTTGHAFATISGGGLISMAADNFPSGDASDFVTAGEGEGKVEFYGDGYSITKVREFFDVDVILNSTASNITLLNNLTVNGDMRIERGIVNINNASNTTPLNIEVNGELYLSSAGQLLTGTANARHQLNLYGDFTNAGGTVKFTQRTAANYNSDATDGIVDVNLLNGTANQVVTCNGPTNFYRIEIDKGVDKTYVASILASTTSNFNLFGRANYGHASVAQLTTNDNALGLLRGTVRIGQNVVVSQLNNTGNYNISAASSLWVDGGTVTKSSGTAIVPYGEVKVSSGELNVTISSGITLRDNGVINVEGGIVNVNQIRTSVLGAEHQGGYKQSGGVVNVLGGSTNTDYYVFNLTYEGNTFQMSGGTLKIVKANSNGGIFINSSVANQNVTGGHVICNIGDANDFAITSRAPFYNVTFEKTVSNANVFVLKDGVDVGSTDVDLVAQPLKVLNDFRIRGEESSVGYENITFNAVTDASNVNDLYVGGSLFFEEGVTYGFAVGGNYPYDGTNRQPTVANTTYFNQTIATSAIDTVYWGHAGGTDNDLDNNQRFELGHFVLDRTSGNELRTVGRSNLKNNQIFIDVNGDTYIESGTLDQGRFTFRTWGRIINKDRMGTWYGSGSYPVAGGTPSTAQIRFREDASVEIITTDNAVFGNLRFNVNPNTTHVTLTSSMKIERMEFMRGAIYLKNHKLTIDNMWNLNGNGNLYADISNSDDLTVTDQGVVGNKIMYTDGKASDGGLALKVYQNTPNETGGRRDRNESPMAFPVGFTPDGGTTVYYRPAQMKVKNFADDGYVSVRPVFGALQTTEATGGEILQHYWRVSHNDFTTLPTVAFQFYYQDKSDVAKLDKIAGASQEANYVPGYVLDESPFTRYYESNPVADVTDVVNTASAGVTRRIVFNGPDTGGEFAQANFTGFTLANANFTCGEANRFTGAPEVYYTRDRSREPRWTDGLAWTRSNILNPSYEPHDSRQPAANDYPKAGDIAVIGWVPWGNTTSSGNEGEPHGMWIDNNAQTCAEVIFTQMKDASGNPVPRVYRSNFQFRPTLCINEPGGQLTAGRISGEGMFWNRNSDPDFSLMDIGEFAANDSSYIVYENNVNNKIYVNAPTEFPNLMVANDGWGGNDRNLTFSKNVKTNGNFEILGDANVVLSTGATGDIEVGRDLILYEVVNPVEGSPSGGGARIDYPNSVNRSITVARDLILVNRGALIRVLSPNTTINEHSLTVGGNIYQKSAATGTDGLKLWTAANQDRITLNLTGSSSMTYTYVDGDVADFYRIVVDKGSSKATTATFNGQFTLNGATSGAGIPKSLELKNGLFVVNHASTAFSLSSGNDYFTIGSTTGLEIKQGSLTVSGTSGISLDGLLRISGGTLNMSGGDNPIVYSVSGNAAIEVTSGSLLVGSQIRRPETDDLGVLKYTQSGGDVKIGVSNGGLSSRGMFEVMNTGSLFSHTGGTFTIVRQNSATPAVAALKLEPGSYNITGSSISIFDGTTPTGQTSFGINTAIPLNNLVINGTNTPAVQLAVRPLTLNSNLTIASGATLDAKGFGITISGNWTNNGTFTPSANEVKFVGSVPQTITGSTSFYKLTKETGGDVLSLAASTDVTVNYLMTLSDGSIDDGGNNIFVKRDIINNGAFISGAGNGVVLNGSVAQRLFGSGTYEKLYLNNSAGFVQDEGNVITVKENLQMEAGVLDIGKNLIVFEENAGINSVAGFSSTNMIQTNISFVDAGLKKFLPAGALSFTYPLGSGGIYTPVELSVTNNTSTTGYIRVKGAKEVHPSVVDLAGTAWDERLNVLGYYWILDASGMTDFMGSVSASYPNNLVSVTAPGKTYNDYITARLLSRGSGDWNKDIGTVDTGADRLTFNFTTPADDNAINGDYTAGLDEAIPDQVPTYTSVKNGDWNDVTTWSPAAPTGGPRGAMVVVNHDVSVPIDYISSYRTTINGASNGRILILGTEGHRLGNVAGTGTLYLETGGLPAGDYTDFLGSAGGTLEFSGSGLDYPVLAGIYEVNNIKFSGTGVRDLPNADLTILGDLTIESSGSLDVVNKYDRKLYVKGDISYNSGSFDAGSGSYAELVLNGSTVQTITGASSFTGTNSLSNFKVNNAAGVTLAIPTEVNNVLTLTNGIINTEGGNLIVINPASNAVLGGSSTAFVDGPMGKYINNNETFDFPIGKAGRIGRVRLSNTSTAAAALWQVEYFNNNPGDDGFDPDIFGGSLQNVSSNEYWKVLGPASAAAKVTVRWDANSGAPAAALDRQNLRIVEWKNEATDIWREVGNVINDLGASYGEITTTNQAAFNAFAGGNYFTIGSIVLTNTTWLGISTDWFSTSNWNPAQIPSASTDVIIPTTPSGGSFFPEIQAGQTFNVNDLDIQASATLTMKPGSKGNTYGDVTVAGAFVIENTNALVSSLINSKPITGNITSNWILPEGRYWYIGMPISNSQYSHISADPVNDPFDLYTYSSNRWNKISDAPTYDASKGNLIGMALKYRDANTQLSFVGTINDGNYTRPLTNTWHLIGNPYTSYIDLENSNVQFGTALKSVWVTTTVGSERVYATYNVETNIGVNGGTRYIAPGQSFWVRSYSAGTFGVNKGARLHATGQLKSTYSDPSEQLRLSVESASSKDEMVIAFMSIGNLGDSKYDSEKKMNSDVKVPSIYSLKGSTANAISIFPEIEEVETIPLGLNVTAKAVGSVQLNFESYQSFLPGVPVFLEDKELNLFHDLRTMPIYQFEAVEGKFEQRFAIHFLDKGITTDIEDAPEDKTIVNEIEVYQEDDQVVVAVPAQMLRESDGRVKMYSLRGELVVDLEINAEVTKFNLPKTTGMYVVNVKMGNQMKSVKMISVR